MTEGLTNQEEKKDPEDVSDLWPEKYRAAKLKPSLRKERDAKREEIKKQLRDEVIRAQEVYFNSQNKSGLAQLRIAKNQYINFVFLAEGTEAATKAEQEMAGQVGEIIKTKRMKWWERWQRTLRWVEIITISGTLILTATLAAALSASLASVAAGALTYTLLRQLSVASWRPSYRKKIKDYEEAEKRARAQGQTLEEFRAQNAVLVSDYIAAKKNIESLNLKIEIFGAVSMALLFGFSPDMKVTLGDIVTRIASGT